MDIRERLKASQEKLNAIVTIIEESPEKTEGPLSGLTIAVKDNFTTKDVLTTGGSRILDNYYPVFDATVIEKLKAAGADLVCKTTLDELGMGGTGINFYDGPTRNPYDYDRIPGGSSGGSAALMGAHLVDIALGSDTGDSVRKPASYSGAIGLKPTYGLISRYGVLPYASSLDHVGFFTSNVDQAGLMLNVLAGRDNKDLTSLHTEKTDYTNLDPSLDGKVFGIIDEIYDAKSDDEYKDKFNKVLEDIEKSGATIKHFSIDKPLLATMISVYNMIANCEATANHSNLDGVRFGHRVEGDTLTEIMTNSRTRGFGSLLKRRFVIGAYGLDDDHQEELFRKAQRVRRLLVEKYREILNSCDAVILPATDTIAPKIKDLGKEETSEDKNIIENHLVLSNFAGTPSITLPFDFVDGLPIGLNLSGKVLSEKNLLGLAKGVEKLVNYKEKEGGHNPWLINQQ